MPLISVIVPVYKVEKYLNRCINSILSQTFNDFELILVDDGSPDRCGEICEEYALQDSRIKVIHQKNSGLSVARNVGIEWTLIKSDSEWITFIDSDDWVHSKYLESLITAAIEKKVELVIGGCSRTDGASPAVSDCFNPIMCNTEYFYVEDNLTASIACGKLYKKDLFANLRFPEGKLHEDEYVTYRILFKYDEVCVINEPLYAYYQNPEGIMRRAWTPARFDSITGIEEQVDYFANNGFLWAARNRFICVIQQLILGKSYVSSYQKFTNAEKDEWTRKLDIKLKNIVLKYHKYRWLTPKDGGVYFQAYGTVFPLYKGIYNLGTYAKRIIKNMRK